MLIWHLKKNILPHELRCPDVGGADCGLLLCWPIVNHPATVSQSKHSNEWSRSIKQGGLCTQKSVHSLTHTFAQGEHVHCSDENRLCACVCVCTYVCWMDWKWRCWRVEKKQEVEMQGDGNKLQNHYMRGNAASYWSSSTTTSDQSTEGETKISKFTGVYVTFSVFTGFLIWIVL